MIQIKKMVVALAFMAAMVPSAVALNVSVTAGKLADAVTNHNVSELVVSGTVDARDFYFIAHELPNLKQIDLSGVSIVAYRSEDALFASQVDFPADELPQFAFFGLPLTRVVLPSGLKTVGRAALSGTSVTSLTLPSGLDSIGAYAFSSCASLTQVSVPASVRVAGRGAWSRCTALTTATLNPSSDFTIPADAFVGCVKLANVSLGARVTVIGANAFGGCSLLKGITVATSSRLAAVESHAFDRSGLNTIEFLRKGQVTQVGSWAFANAALVAANVPTSVTSLGEGAFFYNTTLTGVTLPSLAAVPPYVLAGDEQVTATEVIPSNATRVGDYAFYNWGSTHFVIPNKVNYIGTQAMAGMTQLQEVEAKPTTVPALGENVWAGVPQSTVTLKVPRGTDGNYKAAAQWKEFLVTPETHLRGDVNGDGYVNGSDVTALYNVVLGINMTHESRADVNEDGYVNGADITALYNILLGDASSIAPAKAPRARHSSDALKAEAVTLRPGGEATLELRLDNATPYTTFQLDLALPVGVSVAGMELGERAGGMAMGFNEITSGVYRALAFSPTLATLDDESGVVLRVTLRADEAFAGGEAAVSQILMVETDETSNWLADFNVRLEATTAIGEIDAVEAAGPVDVYNLQGQLIRRQVPVAEATEGLPAGTYIVGHKKVKVN